VTYDAMTHMAGQSNTASKQFSAIWPECTGVFIVTVGNDGTGIQTNMTLDRMDAVITKEEARQLDAEHDILFYLGDEGAEYSFKPESGTTVMVARSTVTDNMTFNGFTSDGVTVAGDGTVTVTGLTTGRHIIRVEKDGLATLLGEKRDPSVNPWRVGLALLQHGKVTEREFVQKFARYLPVAQEENQQEGGAAHAEPQA